MNCITPRALAAMVSLALVACVPQPTYDDLYYQDIVLTTYNEKTTFSAFKTFAVPPDITVVKTNELGNLVTSQVAAPTVVQAIVDQMKAAGYTQVQQGPGVVPDIGFGLTGLIGEVTGYYSNYYCAYWSYWYYPYYYGCYPTYPVSYELYKTRTLVIDMLDLKSVPPGGSADAGRTPAGIVWTSVLYGVLTDGSTVTVTDSARVVNSIGEAFAQSPYVKAGN